MYLSLFQDKAAKDNTRYAERGWKTDGSQEESEEKGNQEESHQEEVAFIPKCPCSGARRGAFEPPAYLRDLRTLCYFMPVLIHHCSSKHSTEERG